MNSTILNVLSFSGSMSIVSYNVLQIREVRALAKTLLRHYGEEVFLASSFIILTLF
jgi:hypothetical protein